MSDISDTDFEKIAELAADKAVAKITDQGYKELGKMTFKGLTYILGVIATAFLLLAASKGWIKLG